MNYSYHPHAEKELEQVEEHYDNIREELGDRFRDEIQSNLADPQIPKGLATTVSSGSTL